MPTRNAEAVWEGDLKGGKGTMKLGSGAYQGAYSFQSRFESGTGTNPEELIAAAHAGCFTMALSHALAQAGHPPKRVHTTAKVHLEKTGDGFGIPRIEGGKFRAELTALNEQDQPSGSYPLDIFIEHPSDAPDAAPRSAR